MATTYEKLSQSTEKSLNEIISEEDTYIAAFKTNVENYKIPVEDFKIPEDTSKVYTFTAKRIYTQAHPTGILVIRDKDGTEVSSIDLFEQLYNDGYTLLIKVTEDNNMPYYSNTSIDKPECIFRLSSTYIYTYTNHRVFNFTFTENQNEVVNAVYTITIRSDSSTLAVMNYNNPYARVPTMLPLSELVDPTDFRNYYPECPGHGNGGLPALENDAQAFAIFVWDQNNSVSNNLILPEPTLMQVKLRAEYIIIWVKAGCQAYYDIDKMVNHDDNIVITPCIINPNLSNEIKLITDGNDINCGQYALFKITAIGHGWEITPLYNCQLYGQATYFGAYAYKELDT